MQLVNIHDDWREIIVKENSTGKTYCRGYDKEGHIIIYMRPARENTNDHDGNIKHLIYSMERAVACLEKTGKEKLSLLIEFDGYSLANAPPMKTSRETLNILQNHYPERLFRAYCIRPPFIFYAFYKIISPFIDPVTKAKIVMLTNADMSNLSNQLYADIDQSILETSLGGGDDRPFDTKLYLQGPFQKEMQAILSESANKESKQVKAPTEEVSNDGAHAVSH